MKILKRLVLGIFIVFILFTGTYALKSHLAINIFDTFHLSSYFPFNYLQPELVIDEVESGYSRVESFEEIKPFGLWRGIYSEDKNIAKRQYDLNGYNKSKSLLVTSSREVFWAINGGFYVHVKPGDSFHYEAKINLQDPAKKVGLGVISYIEERKSPKYSFVVQEADNEAIGQWQTISTNFTIPKGIHYITPRIWGVTNGQVRFDEINLNYTGSK